MVGKLVEPRFIVDTMLGTVARWLRMLGYDTLYDNEYEDWEILRIAEREDRIVITRDSGLHRKAINNGIKSIYLSMNDMAERLAYIALYTGLNLYVDLEKSRCPICNSELRKVPKVFVKDKVPPRVYRFYEDFWICSKCGKVYWVGSHWIKIEEILSKARNILEKYKCKGMENRGVLNGSAGSPK